MGGRSAGGGGSTIGRMSNSGSDRIGPTFRPITGRGHIYTRINEGWGEAPYLEVRGSRIEEDLRGTGLGQGMYIAGMMEAQKRGIGFMSDTRSLSPAATRVWESLRAKLPSGAMVREVTDDGRDPHFSISSESLRRLGPNFNWRSLETESRQPRLA